MYLNILLLPLSLSLASGYTCRPAIELRRSRTALHVHVRCASSRPIERSNAPLPPAASPLLSDISLQVDGVVCVCVLVFNAVGRWTPSLYVLILLYMAAAIRDVHITAMRSRVKDLTCHLFTPSLFHLIFFRNYLRLYVHFNSRSLF